MGPLINQANYVLNLIDNLLLSGIITNVSANRILIKTTTLNQNAKITFSIPLLS